MSDVTTIQEVLAALVIIISWVIALLQNRQKAAVIAVMSEPTKANGNQKASALAELPERSWKMSEETKKWLMASESKEDQIKILQQISDAEFQKALSYQVIYSLGGYQIEYGLIKSSWRSK